MSHFHYFPLPPFSNTKPSPHQTVSMIRRLPISASLCLSHALCPTWFPPSLTDLPPRTKPRCSKQTIKAHQRARRLICRVKGEYTRYVRPGLTGSLSRGMRVTLLTVITQYQNGVCSNLIGSTGSLSDWRGGRASYSIWRVCVQILVCRLAHTLTGAVAELLTVMS